MPLRVRCDAQLPNMARQREHRDEATGVPPATFLHEATRGESLIVAEQPCPLPEWKGAPTTRSG
jgi:hypothetical protein